MFFIFSLSVGVGFDTKGAGKLTINKPIDDVEIYQITDDREGWVISVEKLINSYFLPNQKTMEFDYRSEERRVGKECRL